MVGSLEEDSLYIYIYIYIYIKEKTCEKLLSRDFGWSTLKK
jgi:hypothetical protein